MKRATIIQLRVLSVLLTICVSQCSYAEFWLGSPANPGAEMNSAQDEWCVHVSRDGLTMVFSGSPFNPRYGGKGKIDIWMATRPDTDEPFGPATNLSSVNTSAHEFSPHLSEDGLSLYFSSDRGGGYGDMDLWVATRPDRTASFGNPKNLGGAVNSGGGDFCPFLSPDGLSLYYNSIRWGGYGSCDIYVATRTSVDSAWGSARNLGSRINSGATDAAPVISDDGLTLYYVSNRSGGLGSDDLYVTTRPSLNSTWGMPVNLGPRFNSAGSDTAICFVNGGQTVFFCSSRPGGTGGVDIWELPIIPIVDFNGDQIVDVMDFCRLANNWCQGELCADVAPGPFGDGVVDHQDLAVLSEYWLEEAPPVGLAAHWKLDGPGDGIGRDDAGDHDATVHGDPKWDAEEDALIFDGTDDYLEMPFVLNPKDGAFSVFVWVKTNVAGRVIISQKSTIGTGRNWLAIDGAGRLVTELKGSGRGGAPLAPGTVITDGQWHRVGLAWDEAYRALYVDDVEVSKDASSQEDLETANGGLHIGADRAASTAGFFTGLMDDVQVYDRAVEP